MYRTCFRTVRPILLGLVCVTLVCLWRRNGIPLGAQSTQSFKARYSSNPIARASSEPSGSTVGLAFRQRSEQMPKWAILFQKEFWKQAAATNHPTSTQSPVAANLDLSAIIERVSHAIGQDEFTGRPRAVDHTYIALFDQRGIRFSPHLPLEPNSKA